MEFEFYDSPEPPKRDHFLEKRDYFAAIHKYLRERAAGVADLIAAYRDEHGDAPMAFLDPRLLADDRLYGWIIHEDTYGLGYPWRTTRFDKDGPMGHHCEKTQHALVLEAIEHGYRLIRNPEVIDAIALSWDPTRLEDHHARVV